MHNLLFGGCARRCHIQQLSHRWHADIMSNIMFMLNLNLGTSVCHDWPISNGSTSFLANNSAWLVTINAIYPQAAKEVDWTGRNSAVIHLVLKIFTPRQSESKTPPQSPDKVDWGGWRRLKGNSSIKKLIRFILGGTSLQYLRFYITSLHICSN